jgi:ankyrin repeat protein
VSPRQPRDIDDDQPLQKILLSLVGDAEKAARQTEADNRLIAAMQASVVDRAAVETALRDGACPDRMLPGGMPVLHAAVQRGDIDLVQLFIKYDAELSDTDNDGASALDTAYRLHFAQGIRALSDAGAPFCLIGNDPRYLPDDLLITNYQTRIDSVLMSAVHKGTADDVKRALALGADANAIENAQGRARYSALHLSIARCDVQKVNALLDAGADVHAVSGRGETSLDMLWWVGAKDLLGNAWYDIYKILDARGGRTLFSRRPEELTLTELRATVPIGLDGKTSALHFLVRMGKMDLVMAAIERSQDGLTRADLMKRSDYYGGETLLDAFVASRRLSQLFTAAVWRERLDDMLSLRPQIDADPRARTQVDFELAARDIRRYQQNELSRRADEEADDIRLKPRPRKANGKQNDKPSGPKGA